MKHIQFGSALRELLTSIDLDRGHSRWFRDHVGEDRALRRWLSGKHLPSPDNWEQFICALKVGREGDPSFLQKLSRLKRMWLEGQEKIATSQRQVRNFGREIRRPVIDEPEPYGPHAEESREIPAEEDPETDPIPVPRDPPRLQALWRMAASTSLHRALGDTAWAWAAEPFVSARRIEDLKLIYRATGPRYRIPAAAKTAFARWCARSEDAGRLMREPWGLQVRVTGARFNHRAHQYEIHLAPTKFLFYRAVQHNLSTPQYRSLRNLAFTNALYGLDREQPLLLPSTFAIHMGVVSSDGKALLRKRSKRTGLYRLSWEAGCGEFMHGPYRTKFPHFTRKGVPSLFLFLKNTVAEELNYRGARREHFLIFGFAAEFLTLAPKLMVVYFSDAPMSKLLKSAKKAKDPAVELQTIDLNVDSLADVLTEERYRRWGPTSKLALLLSLIHLSGSDEKSVTRQLEEKRRNLIRTKIKEPPR